MKKLILSQCPGCIKNSRGGLDLTEGLFAYFAPHSVGLITLNWCVLFILFLLTSMLIVSF